jgi:hypothetical protein
MGAENLVLKALDSEIASETKASYATIDAATISSLTSEGKKSAYKKCHDITMEAHRLRTLNWNGPSTQRTTEVDSLVNLYYALEKAGIIKDEPTDET